MDKQKAIIVDLDGTLCDVSDRRQFVEQEPKDYSSFYYNLVYDKVNRWCRDLVYAMMDADVIPLFTSGRPEKHIMGMNEYHVRIWSQDWLVKHMKRINRPYIESHLFMRPTGDHREDYIVKRELYEMHIKDKYDVVFCIDDRTQVVQLWRSLGLVCLQCCEGNY
jgi:FMN phosphatase YigB (HAD superfamily)